MALAILPLFWILSLLSCLLSPALAQTWTYCNPMKKTDCPNHPALGTNYTTNFTGSLNDVIWNTTSGEIVSGKEGAEFKIVMKLDSPTIQSHFYIFFGRVEAHVKAAHGKGVISSVILQSETLDEIDWEWIGSDSEHVQTNYFGKGDNTTYDRGKEHKIANPIEDFRNYTLIWTKEKIEWYVDNDLIRTLLYDEAKGGTRFPQTPSTVRLGIWPAGDKANSEHMKEWAGGEIDYGAGPYTMVVNHLKVTDFSHGKEYEYTDQSGDWQSIKIHEGVSKVQEEVTKPPPKSISQRWAELSTGAKAAIFGSIGGAFLFGIALMAFCCVKQRRAGRREFNNENSKFVDDQNKNMALRSQWGHKYKQVDGH
ncbi:hypothetical protein FQN57_004252 [Myotisia sp. PD_48]|nr:hypothetical protein FQN57_004252 [Myotisia sp. PD_48]